MKNRDISPEDNENLDKDRIRQERTNLTMIDRRPGESTFPNGTKNHSTRYDHAQNDIPMELIGDVTLENNLHIVDDLFEAERRTNEEEGLDMNLDDLEDLTMEDLEKEDNEDDDDFR
ncbi:hypothetical protein [Telluribacter sp. SYSU D00476]|uniref:hypothetical protein n=1 Tax=Telluribacter sp. SYSU D00476 TaxID=2811430 RepID=UPI001FF6B9FA|nr:hypothetical protein [Telluribacter sp. SYSU D00476]